MNTTPFVVRIFRGVAPSADCEKRREALERGIQSTGKALEWDRLETDAIRTLIAWARELGDLERMTTVQADVRELLNRMNGEEAA